MVDLKECEAGPSLYDGARLLAIVNKYVSALTWPFMIASCAEISRVEAHRGVVYSLKRFEMPYLSAYGVRDFTQVTKSHQMGANSLATNLVPHSNFGPLCASFLPPQLENARHSFLYVLPPAPPPSWSIDAI